MTYQGKTPEPVHPFRITGMLSKVGQPGRPTHGTKPIFTPEQVEIAVNVLMYSHGVMNWVVAEAKFLGVDIDSPQGHEFFRKNARAAAERVLK
jgi:hypothetical protein